MKFKLTDRSNSLGKFAVQTAENKAAKLRNASILAVSITVKKTKKTVSASIRCEIDKLAAPIVVTQKADTGLRAINSALRLCQNNINEALRKKEKNYKKGEPKTVACILPQKHNHALEDWFLGNMTAA